METRRRETGRRAPGGAERADGGPGGEAGGAAGEPRRLSPGDDRVHGGDSLHGALNSVPKVPDLEINEFRHDISSGGAGPRQTEASHEPSFAASLSRQALESRLKKSLRLSCQTGTHTKKTPKVCGLSIVRSYSWKTFEVREPSISACVDAKLERRSRPPPAHKARHGFESNFRVVAVTPLRAGPPHASLRKPQDTRSFRRSPCRLLPLTKPPRRAPRPGPTSPASAASPAPQR